MNKKVVLAVFMSVLFLSMMFRKGSITTVSASTTLEGIWSQKANMTYGRQFPSMGVVNGKIYVIGGRACLNDSDVGTRYKYNEEYDPTTDTWTTKAPKPAYGDGGATGVVNGKIYVIGQYPSGRENYMYDPVGDNWTSKKQMPTKRWDSLGLVLTDSVGNDVIYVTGGTLDGAGKKTVEVYCPNNDTWITKADMNEPRAKHAGSVYNGKIYVFSSDYDSTKTAEVYDPSTNTWTYITSSPEKVRAASQNAIYGKIWLMKTDTETTPNQWYYDPETDTYTLAADCPYSIGSTSLERPVINNTCYLIGGGYWHKQKTCYAFTITEKTPSVGGIWMSPNKLELLAPWIALASAIISTVAITAVFLKRGVKEKAEN